MLNEPHQLDIPVTRVELGCRILLLLIMTTFQAVIWQMVGLEPWAEVISESLCFDLYPSMSASACWSTDRRHSFTTSKICSASTYLYMLASLSVVSSVAIAFISVFILVNFDYHKLFISTLTLLFFSVLLNIAFYGVWSSCASYWIGLVYVDQSVIQYNYTLMFTAPIALTIIAIIIVALAFLHKSNRWRYLYCNISNS